MHYTFASRRNFRNLSLAFLVGISAIAFGDSTQEDKIDELLPVAPLGVADNGNVFSRLVGFEEIFAWDNATSTQKMVKGASQSGFSPFGAAVEITYDASQMLVADYSPTGNILSLIELTKPGFPAMVIPETRVLGALPRFSADGTRYAFAGMVDQQSFGLNGAWVFNLSEFLFDAQRGSQQPTGFYLDTVVAPKTRANPNVFVQGDRIAGMAWSASSNELAYVLTNGTNNKTVLMIYDPESGKQEEVTGIQAVARLDWPAGDYIYFSQFAGGGQQLFRLDRVKKTSESVLAEAIDTNSVSFSIDGKWMFYSKFAGNAITATLFDLTAKKGYEIPGAFSAKFGGRDSRTVVLQRAGLDPTKQEAPFYVTRIEDLVGIAANGKIDLAALKPVLAEAGRSVPSYVPPTDKAEFEKKFEWINMNANFRGGFLSANASLKNVSDKFYTFRFTSFDFARCVVRDDTGKILGETPPQQSEPNRMLLGAGKLTGFNCFLQFNPLPPTGTKATVTLELAGHKGGSIERQITL